MPELIGPPPIVVPYAAIPQYRFLVESELSNMDFGYLPTSVYIDGVQTYEYVIQGSVVYFNNMIPTGATITALPPDAVRILDAAIVTIDVEEVGIHSVFSDPFGRMLFSSNGTDWFKSLTRVYPATVYCKLAPHDYITDFLCRAEIEIVIWAGNDAFINESGEVEVNATLPVGATDGGLEYHVI